MSDLNNWNGEKSLIHTPPAAKDLENVANDLCEKSLRDAKNHLHPLLHMVELDALEHRSEFVRAFKGALEQRVAQKVAVWQPDIQAVFKFDEMPLEDVETWDGSVHLLVKVPRLSNAIKTLGKKLDQSLVGALKRLSWSRFQKRQSILDIQQVTPNELRHGIGYGGMFYAVYTVPIKVWPQDRQTKGEPHRRTRRGILM